MQAQDFPDDISVMLVVCRNGIKAADYVIQYTTLPSDYEACIPLPDPPEHLKRRVREAGDLDKLSPELIKWLFRPFTEGKSQGTLGDPPDNGA
jgi:hypothetical protein